MGQESYRVCKRCLMRDMLDKDLEFRKIEEMIERLPASEKASESVYGERLSVCTGCDFLSDGTCSACGCYVELRAATKSGRCPKKKW